MKKFFLGCFAGVVVILVILFGVATYLGFVPRLSDKFVKRVDLGVVNDPKAVLALRQETGFQNKLDETTLPTKSTILYDGKINIDTTVDSGEVTAVLNTWSDQDYYTPYSNVQVRLNPDGTAEGSMDIDVNLAAEMASRLGFSDEDIEKGKKYLNILSTKVYVYTKMEAEVVENQVTVKGHSLRIQNFNVPANFVDPLEEVFADMVEKRFAQVTNLDVKSFKQEGDKIKFTGTIPASMSTN